MGQARTFFEAIKTSLEAVQYNAADAFAVVHISPVLDLDALIQVPRFPMAVIVPGPTTLNPANSTVWSGSFDVVMLSLVPRDHIGTEATLDLEDRAESMIDSLNYDNDASVFYAANTAAEALLLKTDVFIVYKTYTFNYSLERD